jgi:hypothetical protein
MGCVRLHSWPVSVPWPHSRDRMWRARRLVACMAAYLDATSLMRLRCVSKACKDVVQRGTTHVVLDRFADPGTVLILGRLRSITACCLGTVGSSRLCAALMSLPAAEVGMGRRLLSLDMTGCGMLDVGLMELSKVAVAGVLTRLEHLFLDGEVVLPPPPTHTHRVGDRVGAWWCR